MKPLVLRPNEESKKLPGQEQAKAGKSGEGASSALEHLSRQESWRVLQDRCEPPPEKPPA